MDRNKNKDTIFLLAGNPGTCIMKIGKSRYMTLIDTGADASLISKRLFDKLQNKPKLDRIKPNLQTASGEALTITGQITLSFTMNGLPLTQKFFVVNGLNRNLILGRDWLKDHGVRLYFDLGMLRIGKTYVRLEEDIHISSILRLDRKITLKPQSAVVCQVKVRQGFRKQDSKFIEVSNIDPGCILEEPGLTIKESVNNINQHNKTPILLFNQTNKFYTLKRGFVVGKGRPIDPLELSEVSELEEKEDKHLDFNNISVPEKHRPTIVRLLKKNADLFAKTDTVTLKIETDHPPIKNETL